MELKNNIDKLKKLSVILTTSLSTIIRKYSVEVEIQTFFLSLSCSVFSNNNTQG